MKKYGLISLLAFVIIGVLAMSSIACAQYVIEEVELDDDTLSASSTNVVRALDRGDEFEVKIHLTSDVDFKNVQVEAEMRGYDHDDRVEDITDVFDMKAGVTYVKKLTLKFAERLDQDRYKLRVQIEDRDSNTVEETYELEIETKRHLLTIKDIVFSPEDTVKAGRALLTTVRVANDGQEDEEGVKIKVSIPALGISASDYIDELEAEGKDDDEKTSEELYMRIPDCSEPGDYKVRVEVIYDDGDEKITKETIISVREGDFCETEAAKEKPKTIITVGVESQDLTQGQGGAVYPLTITNMGTTTKSYTVGVEGVDSFGASRVSPSNFVVLGAGETKAVYVYVSAKEDAPVGQNMFAVTVSSGGEVLQQITLKANVLAKTAAGWDKVKRALEVGLVVLVILLVILGLIIGFSKLKGKEETEETESQTYY